MRVLITGGAGFIGSHLADAFLARGDSVFVADDMSRGLPERVDPRASLHTLSVRDGPALTALATEHRPALICHLAAHIDVRASVADPAADAQVNVVGTVNVLEAARAAGARVVLASSGGALYGRDVVIPSPETAPLRPESPYGTAKLAAENYLDMYNRQHGTRHATLRLANVYGPRQDPAGEAGVVALFCAGALAGRAPVVYGDGTQTRDYVYVGDTVRAFLAAADAGRPGTWNIGTGLQTSVLDLLATVAEAAGRPMAPEFGEHRPGDLPHSAVDPGLAADDLGWRPVTRLADGVRQVFRWIEAGAPANAPAWAGASVPAGG